MEDPRKRTRPPLEVRLRAISAVDYADGETKRERIKNVAKHTFTDPLNGTEHQFKWTTISTWLYRMKSQGLTSIENKTRSDKHTHRKVTPAELAEAIDAVLPSISPNKVGRSLKSAILRKLRTHNYFTRSQLSQTSFYRIVKKHRLMDKEACRKMRQSFAMQFANEMWQADTMYGPNIKQANGQWKKTFLIAFIDDASRVITHGEFFYNDNTSNAIEAFRSALYKRGKPERLYLDNGANYRSKEILQACLRLGIKISHAPVRDGAAKGKVERFFRGFRDRFLTQHKSFSRIEELNAKTNAWIEEEYNNAHHSGIGMIPIDRFNLDSRRLEHLELDEISEEVFFVEETRKVTKTNTFSINNQRYECPVDLCLQKIQVRFNRNHRERIVVYYDDKRMGEACPLDLHRNSLGIRKRFNKNSQE